MHSLVLLMLIIVVQDVQSTGSTWSESCRYNRQSQPTCQGPFAEYYQPPIRQIFYCCDTGFSLLPRPFGLCACVKQYDATECIQDTCPTGVKMVSGDGCICAHYLRNRPEASPRPEMTSQVQQPVTVACKSNEYGPTTCEGPFAEYQQSWYSQEIRNCCDTGFKLRPGRPLGTICVCLKEYDVTECIQDTCPTGVKMVSGDNCICAHYL